MVAYILLLIPVAIISYGIGSMDTLVLASNFVFRTNLRKLGQGNNWLSNFKRVYGFKGIMLLFGTEVVKNAIPIVIGGLLLLIKGHFTEGCAFAGFCLVLGRLWPIFYNLKGSHATIAMIMAGLFTSPSLGIVAAIIAAGILFWTKRLSLATVAGAVMMAVIAVLMLDVDIQLILTALTSGAVIVRHLPDIVKLIKGQDEKIEIKEDLSYKFEEDF